MGNTIALAPVEMTPVMMEDLENRGLIIRLCPGHHAVAAPPGETIDTPIYESQERYGPHKLISVTVNRTTPAEFGTHPDNEEFLLIGDPDTKPIYVIIAIHLQEELNRKIRQRELAAADFVCLRARYNDAAVSFFTMLADVPHGEAVGETVGRAPSFYVTEPRDLPTELTEFGEYELRVADSH